MSGWLTTNRDDLRFEDTSVGRLKKKIWEASDQEIDAILKDYGIPSSSELAKPGTYIQTTIRQKVVENRRKNDIVFVPIGCTELHGRHTVTALDSFMVTQILEGVRRHSMKTGTPVNLAWNPLNYGGHPHHHIGMPGTIHLEDEVLKRVLIDIMVGLWNDGFRKIILINNHGHSWLLEAAIQELQKTWNLPGIFRTIDWHRAVREFFRTKDRGGAWDDNFFHADEAETSVMLLLAPEYVEMALAQETKVDSYLPDGHMDKAVDPFARPCRWSEGQGHGPMEINSIPEGVVGRPTISDAKKAKRTIAAILSYLTLVWEEINTAFPAGTFPPIEKTTMRTEEEMAPYLKEPFTEGWRPIYAIRKMGL
ncbi:MAG: 3-dehydro-scyllo-inosose hydrolase [Candidatus Marinimicrobia bacterium]|nr:3-dehydro-scyllo-inosose hydrolase [Candidatus Neomarinimicrobiota bacterium]